MVGLFYFFETILQSSIIFLKASLFISTIFNIISGYLSKYSPEKFYQTVFAITFNFTVCI